MKEKSTACKQRAMLAQRMLWVLKTCLTLLFSCSKRSTLLIAHAQSSRASCEAVMTFKPRPMARKREHCEMQFYIGVKQRLSRSCVSHRLNPTLDLIFLAHNHNPFMFDPFQITLPLRKVTVSVSLTCRVVTNKHLHYLLIYLLVLTV